MKAQKHLQNGIFSSDTNLGRELSINPGCESVYLINLISIYKMWVEISLNRAKVIFYLVDNGGKALPALPEETGTGTGALGTASIVCHRDWNPGH